MMSAVHFVKLTSLSTGRKRYYNLVGVRIIEDGTFQGKPCSNLIYDDNYQLVVKEDSDEIAAMSPAHLDEE